MTHALIDATTAAGQQLFAVALSQPGVTLEPASWVGIGMARTDTRAVSFSDVTVSPVGDVGAYLDRPGFWAGAVGVAACWHGGTVAVADAFWGGPLGTDPHRRAHLGAVHAALAQNQALLQWAAGEFDGDLSTAPAVVARTVRSAIASNAVAVIDRTGRALGPTPLAFDEKHAQTVADLLVYIRQDHAERDLERLGSDLIDRQEPWVL